MRTTSSRTSSFAGHGRAAIVVTMATFAMVSVGLMGTVLFPVLHGDEAHHTDMVLFASEPDNWDDWPGPGGKPIGAEVRGAMHAYLRPRTADSVPTALHYSFEELADGPLAKRRVNLATLHPPMFYVIEAGLAEGAIWLSGGHPMQVDHQMWIYRATNVLLLIPVPWLIYATVRRLGVTIHSAAAASMTPLLVPGLTLRVAPRVSNDNLLVLLGGITTYLVVRVVNRDESWFLPVAVGVTLGLAASTKAFGLVLFPVAGLAYFVATRRSPPAARTEQLKRGITALGLGTVVGGGWYLRGFALYGQVRPELPNSRSAPPAFDPDWGYWLSTVWQRNLGSFFGGRQVFGPEDPLSWVFLAVIVGGVALAFRRYDPTVVVLLILPVLLIGPAVLADSAFYYGRYEDIGNVHARYYYIGLPALLAVAWLGVASLASRTPRRLLPFVGVAGVILSLLGTHALLTHASYWGEPDGALTELVAAVLAWSPVGVLGALLIIVLAVLSLAGLLVAASWASLGTDAETLGHQARTQRA